ncbi:hypothetical protein T484DRAFT_1755549 [Baffinella frigidus]|nr:hypothetical protein T484DRAFT_1755549 [Cryptophyta sp. CCMP2293]
MSQDYRQIDPRIFISPPPHVFKCSVCLHLMFQPTTFCPGGHTLCNSCWNGVFANDQKIGKAPTCPICRAPTTDLGTLNQPIASQIDELTVRCEHANLAQPEPALLEAGSMPKRPKITQSGCCVWQGPISNAASHRLIDCPQQRTKCPLQFSCVGAPEGAWSCPTVVLRKDMEAHTLNCKWRPVTCNGCALRVPLERHDFHVEQHCVAAPLGCCLPGCTASYRRDYQLQHLANDCQFVLVPCPNPGCEENVPRRELETHMRQNMARHLSLSNAKISQLEDRVTRLERVATTM